MTSPQDIQNVFVAAFAVIPTAALYSSLQFVMCRWDKDALVVKVFLEQAQKSVFRLCLVSFGTLILLSTSDLEGLFGLASILKFDFGWSHSAALFTGLLAAVFSTRALLDPVGWEITSVAMIAVAILSRFEVVPKTSAWALPSLGAGAWILLFCFWRFRLFRTPRLRNPKEGWIYDQPIRGAKLTAAHNLRETFNKQIDVSSEGPIYFGFEWVPIEASEGNFLFAGVPGSGKSVSQRLMMQSVLPRIQPCSNHRALILDAKGDAISVVGGMGLMDHTHILNPFDARCKVWDVQTDIISPDDALQLAELLKPDGTEHEKFWSDATRGILADVVIAHILAVKRQLLPAWTFSDVIRSLKSIEDLKTALALVPETKDSLSDIKEEKTLAGVFATLSTVRRKYEVLAALWDAPALDASRRISLAQWVGSSGILILPHRASASEVLAPMNRLIIERIGELLIDTPERHVGRDQKSYTWLFLDEFPQLQKSKRFDRILTTGRSKNIVPVLGIQDSNDLKDKAKYGDPLTITILGACQHKMLFQAGSEEHATFCEKITGNEDVLQLAVSRSSSPQGGSTITSTPSEKLKALVLKDEFLNLGLPGERTPIRKMPRWVARSDATLLRPIRAFYETSFFSPFTAVCRVRGQIMKRSEDFHATIAALMPRIGDDFVQRSVDDQFLKYWPAVDDNEPADTDSRLGAEALRSALFGIQRPKLTTTRI